MFPYEALQSPTLPAPPTRKMKLIDLLHSKMEVLRLEKKYVKRRNRKSGIESQAIYVDGDYMASPRRSVESIPTAPRKTSIRESTFDSNSSSVKGLQKRKRFEFWKDADGSRKSQVSMREVLWQTSTKY